MEFQRNLIEGQRRAPRHQAWIETLVVTTLTVWLGYLSHPEDPYLLRAEFSWSLLGPLLVAVRYGFFFGFMSALLLLASLGIGLQLQWLPPMALPYNYALGVVIVAMLAGEFRDLWQRRLERLQESNRYRQIRLDEFTRNYHLLKVSHDRLEQQVAGSGQSLREAIRNLRKQLARLNDVDAFPNPAVARSMLMILAEYGPLQQASLHLVTADTYEPKPLAHIGKMEPVAESDPILRECIKSRNLVSIDPDFIEAAQSQSELLACVPLLDAEGHLWAVVNIRLMPLFAFQDKTLRLLAILAGHMADLLFAAKEVRMHEQEEATELHLNLRRALRDREQFGIPAVLIVYDIVRNDDGDHLVSLIERMRRGLDVLFKQSFETSYQLLMLLPLTDELGAAGYRQRSEELARNQFGRSLGELPVQIHRHSLQDAEKLRRFLTEVVHHGQQMADRSIRSL